MDIDPTLRKRIETLLRQNRRVSGEHSFTVPSPDTYPFQWYWDSCFHSIIYSYFDPEAAKSELRSVTSAPLASGLFPHMIYWNESAQNMRWGREREGGTLTNAWGTVGTSSITQPPLLAVALWQVYEVTNDKAFLAELYDVTASYYKALLHDRNVTGHGLLGIINPDESGEDNSPRFDDVQELPIVHTAMDSLNRRIDRVREHADCAFDTKNCTSKLFWVEDVGFNAIAVKALSCLVKIAKELEQTADAKWFAAAREKLVQAMQREMYDGDRYCALQGLEQEKITVKTWNIFMPLYAGILTKAEAGQLVEQYFLNEKTFATPFLVPTVAIDEPSFAANDMWRGPTWIGCNWFVYKGLVDYGFITEANHLKRQTLALIKQSGFREFYHPHTGEGYGAHNFTWGGLVLDMK